MKAKVNIQDLLILVNAEITKNPNSTYHDVYPIVKKAIQTQIGITILATEKMKTAGAFDNTVGSYEKALRYKMFWIVDNGRTLCKKCHKTTDTYLRYNARKWI